MKINQFGVIKRTFEQKINELALIGFYDEKIQAAISKGSVPLLQALLEQAAQSTAVTTKFDDYMVNEQQDLAAFFATDKQVTNQEFDAIALQLLNFEESVDYNLADSVQAVNRIGLVFSKDGDWSTHDVLNAWYDLLTTIPKVVTIY